MKKPTKIHREVGQEPDAGPHWLTRKQLAKRYNVSVRCVDYWVEARRVPVFRIGRVVRFDPRECDEALRSYRIPNRA
jgi:excisionase family DNA binding protein